MKRRKGIGGYIGYGLGALGKAAWQEGKEEEERVRRTRIGAS